MCGHFLERLKVWQAPIGVHSCLVLFWYCLFFFLRRSLKRRQSCWFFFSLFVCGWQFKYFFIESTGIAVAPPAPSPIGR